MAADASSRFAGLILLFLIAILAIALLQPSPRTVAEIVGFIFLAGWLSYQSWQNRRQRLSLSRRLDKQAGLHDRLVREVARGRGDLLTLREGLSDTAARVRNLSHEGKTSPEAHMIETIVAQLSKLGERPVNLGQPAPQIVELEMNPPPLLPTTSGLSSRLGHAHSDAMILRLIDQAVREDEIDVFLQPIVSLPQRKLRMFEMFARLRAGDGEHLTGSQYLSLAQREQKIPAIDNLLLLRCLQMLRKSADAGATPFVLNIGGDTLADGGFMGDLLAFLAENRPMAQRLIFEMTQGEVDSLTAQSIKVLEGLAQLGCRFSMDGVRQRRLDLGQLKTRHIRYIKIDAAWLIKEGGQRNGPAKVARFKQQLDGAGIDLIVERVENDMSLRAVLDYAIDFGQGYLFGKPDNAAVWLSRKFF